MRNTETDPDVFLPFFVQYVPHYETINNRVTDNRKPSYNPFVGIIHCQFSSGRFRFGTGWMFKESKQIYYVITCAHVLNSNELNLEGKRIEEYFNEGEFIIRWNEMIIKMPIKKCHIQKEFYEEEGLFNGYNIALLEVSCERELDIPLSSILEFREDKIKEKMKISVTGINNENELVTMEGSLSEVQTQYYSSRVFFTYDDIYVSPGQSGSPITILNEETSTIEVIGIHVGVSNYGRAVGIAFNRQVNDWINSVLNI